MGIEHAHAERASALLGPSRAPAIAVDLLACKQGTHTRFVAGFVGRTNLLEARVEAGALLLGNLSLGPAAAAGIARDVSGNILLSLRPQAMSLHVTEPARESAALIMPVTILERTYLGEAWDYVLRPEGAELRLRAAAPPLAAHEIGAKLWLRIDPQQIAVVQ